VGRFGDAETGALRFGAVLRNIIWYGDGLVEKREHSSKIQKYKSLVNNFQILK
jgi:hypothetical protein